MEESKKPMHDENVQLIGNTQSLVEGGKGLRFDVENTAGEKVPAFVVLFDGQFFAYLNQCGHIAMQLDYMPGEFFSDDGQTLICATHGAEYAPDTGACLGGPCYGVGLDAITISEVDGKLYLHSDTLQVITNN
jgi:nitrite reductase/ring-hydroxylating ferredoxin subunit